MKLWSFVSASYNQLRSLLSRWTGQSWERCLVSSDGKRGWRCSGKQTLTFLQIAVTNWGECAVSPECDAFDVWRRCDMRDRCFFVSSECTGCALLCAYFIWKATSWILLKLWFGVSLKVGELDLNLVALRAHNLYIYLKFQLAFGFSRSILYGQVEIEQAVSGRSAVQYVTVECIFFFNRHFLKCIKYIFFWGVFS